MQLVVMSFLVVMSCITVALIVLGYAEMRHSQKEMAREIKKYLESFTVEVSDDLKDNQTIILDSIKQNRTNSGSQLDNLRKAFRQPIKVHERSGTE